MKLPVFKLEDYLGKWEFKAPYLFCTSDMESISMKELLALADSQGQDLWENLRLGYTEIAGLPPLLGEISKLYSKIEPSQILTFAGAEEGIYSLFHSLLTEQDHVIVLTPCYQSLLSIPQSIGCKITEIPLDPKNGWELDLDLLQSALQPKTKLIIINLPHNPTGTLLDHGTQKALIEVARKNGIYIFSDEVYHLMEVDPKDRLQPICDIYERGISLGVMSKAYGLAGLRVGWIATQDAKIIKEAEQVKHYLSICNSAPSEVLAFIALRAKEKLLDRNREIVRKNLSLLDGFFSQYPQRLQWTRPKGGCTAFPKLLNSGSVDVFAAQLVEKTGVLIMPGTLYSCPGDHFRIGFGRKNMPQALERFGEFLEQYKSK
jgi:aspartate/methionine/tyrosine aminotransferase